MAEKREERASGSYGFLTVLRHPSLIFGGTRPQSSDLAPGATEAVTVSCFLRGSPEPYPKRLKQGTLRISGGKASWSSSFGHKTLDLVPGIKVQRVNTRAADEREPNVKHGGTAFGVVAVPEFTVVSCSTTDGCVDFVAPSVDEAI